MDKVDGMQEQMGNVNRKVYILKKKKDQKRNARDQKR